MEILKTIEEVRERVREQRGKGRRIALVPTMGCLHEGHLSLIDQARKMADVVAVTIYVNPTQFGPSEDFENYPRTLEKDLEMCRQRGVDLVYTPEHTELYPNDYSTYIKEEKLSAGLCGISRPEFFRGVCTIVAKLFIIVMPDVAVFGRKDAQQLAVIRKMARDLHLPVEIVGGPTVREPDGLAMSSRNTYLDEFQRRDAVQIYRALLQGKELADAGQTSVDRILAEIVHHLRQYRRLRVIYAQVVHVDTMAPLREIIPGKSLVATAVWCDEVRLIDNIIL